MRITRLGFRFALAALALCVVAGPSRADDGLKIETILSDLDNPSGVAIQPETGAVFVSNSGASQVIKVVDGKSEPVITDFPWTFMAKVPSTTSDLWVCCFSIRTRWSSVAAIWSTAMNCFASMT